MNAIELGISATIQEQPRTQVTVKVNQCEKDILQVLYRNGAVSRHFIFSQSEFTKSKVQTCITSLVQKEMIVPYGEGLSTGGRRPGQYSINGDYGYIAGVDIGATSIDLILANMARKVISRMNCQASIRSGPYSIINQVETILLQMLSENNIDTSKLLGIGVGIPGPVDFQDGTVVSPPIMPGWDGFPIAQTLQESFPYSSVVIDNDVNIMALGESQYGASIGIPDSIFVKIGTGIGSGIICNGQIYRGINGCAGDIGHICVDNFGPVCPCGNTGCLEAMAAGPAIAHRGFLAAQSGKSPILLRLANLRNGVLLAEDVGAAAAEGDTASIEIIRDSGSMIGNVLAGLVNFYNPSMIIIGGGVSNIGNLLLASIRQAVLSRSLPLATRNLQIVFSSIGSDAGVSGAVNLAFDYIFQVELGTIH